MNLDPSAFVATPYLLARLESQADPVACDRPRILFRQGEIPAGLYILHAGAVTLSMTSPAGDHLFSVPAAPGSLLGLPGLIGDEPYTLSAIAQPGAHLSYLSREAFTAFMRDDPALALEILRILAAEVRSARKAMLETAPPPLTRRRIGVH